MVRHYDVSFLMCAVSSQTLPYREPASDLTEIGNYNLNPDNLNPGPRILNNRMSGKKHEKAIVSSVIRCPAKISK